MMNTHDVVNQPPAFDYNLFSSDLALQRAVESMQADWSRDSLLAYGKKANSHLQRTGFDANKFRPVLRSHDRFGNRINQVDYHDA